MTPLNAMRDASSALIHFVLDLILASELLRLLADQCLSVVSL